MKFLFAEQHAALAQQIDDVDVGVENVLADQIRQTGFIREPPMIIDRRQDRQFVFTSETIIIFTVTGRDMHRAGARVHRDEIGGQDDRLPIKKRMLRADLVDLAAGK